MQTVAGFVLLFALGGIALAETSQQGIQPPSPSVSHQVLELAPAVGATLPPEPPVIVHPRIGSAFLGCWEGQPDGWDYTVSGFGSGTVGSPGRIVFCYRDDRIEVPEVNIAWSAGDWAKDVALNLGLGLTLAKLIPVQIETRIYGVTDTQIHARTFVPMKVTQLFFWIIPISKMEMLVDEELGTLTPEGLHVVARQSLVAPGVKSLRGWHADFHRLGETE